ncbi:hypothetical protein ACIRD3_34070 [Kitasatospora sp. NPDC093550]|uniref:hypothetical protein n=1 Tax=Kitasatospora sp. NPDC093550 TaxID=3364089 RepID=UPI0037FC778C
MKTTKTLRHLAIGTAAGTLALTGVLAGAGNAAADGIQVASMAEPGVLYRNDRLEAGDTRLIMQGDGNLVMYRNTGNGDVPLWSTHSAGCGDRAIMQGDGNLVVYGTGTRICWANNVFKGGPGTAALEVHSGGGLHIEMGAGSTNYYMNQITIVRGSSDPY